MSRKTYYEDYTAKDRGNGPIDLFMSVPSSEIDGGCFIGRIVALYDHVVGKLTVLSPLQEPDVRGRTLAFIGNWTESQPKRVRLVYSRICADCHGIGREQVLDENITYDSIEKWYRLQKDALASSDLLRKVLKKVWGGNNRDMIEALEIPGFAFSKWNSWTHCMSPDIITCMRAAFLTLTMSDDGYALLSGEDWDSRDLPEKFEDYANVREDFAKAWLAKEEELLALSPERRPELWEN